MLFGVFNIKESVIEYLPQYADSEFTFATSFDKYCCMDEYNARFDVFSKSNASKDQIFIQLYYSQVDFHASLLTAPMELLTLFVTVKMVFFVQMGMSMLWQKESANS